MATRDEITTAIRAVDARLDGLRRRILAHGEQPPREGMWRVRDALSHLSARASPTLFHLVGRRKPLDELRFSVIWVTEQPRCGLLARLNVQLREHVLEVLVDGAHTDNEGIGDLGVA